MKRLVLAATAAFIWAMPATAQSVNTAFIQMLNETGCDSRYNDDKKAFVFDRDYRNREMTVVGEFVNASSGSIFVKVLPSTLTFDVSIRLRNAEDAFDLEKGQRVTVKPSTTPTRVAVPSRSAMSRVSITARQYRAKGDRHGHDC
jgi:hypothetical protein